jgi:hypothetical protein
MSWTNLIGLVYWLRTFSSYDTEGGKVSGKERGGLAREDAVDDDNDNEIEEEPITTIDDDIRKKVKRMNGNRGKTWKILKEGCITDVERS